MPNPYTKEQIDEAKKLAREEADFYHRGEVTPIPATFDEILLSALSTAEQERDDGEKMSRALKAALLKSKARCAELEARLQGAAERFSVIDKLTGQEPDIEEIALHEEWAKGLVYCDMEGFAVEEDGTLLLIDECGNMAYCPPGRFEIRAAIFGEKKED